MWKKIEEPEMEQKCLGSILRTIIQPTYTTAGEGWYYASKPSFTEKKKLSPFAHK